MLHLAAQRESRPWLSHSALLSGCFAFLACQALVLWLQHANLMGIAATLVPIIALAPIPAAIALGLVARCTEPAARWESSLGILFGVITLLLMCCYIMMTFLMGSMMNSMGTML
jgi:hypothetical protein